MHIHIPYRNLMVEICLTDFSWKCISRIVGNLEMTVDASVVGINPAVVSLTEYSLVGCTISNRARKSVICTGHKGSCVVPATDFSVWGYFFICLNDCSA